MHIILVSDHLATARTLTITLRHMVLAFAGLVLMVIGLSTLFSYVTVRHAAELRLPFLQSLIVSMREQETRKTRQFMQDNLNAMAERLGRMQAQLMQLDNLGERLGQMSGIKRPEVKHLESSGTPTAKAAQGGPLIVPILPPRSTEDLQHRLDQLSLQLDARSDHLSLIESELLDERIRYNQVPTAMPVHAQWNSSSYGWRSDPFTGVHAMHEGVDFPVPPGTPIFAAANGMVVTAEFNAGYGNMIEIDHGNDLITRYAHASKLLVKPGTLVKRGQKVALSGSSGRSTGPHLHFEVRYKGAAQNPFRFLEKADSQQNLALSTRP